MLLNPPSPRFIPHLRPFKTAGASFKRSDGFLGLGVAGTVLLLQGLRRVLGSKQSRLAQAKQTDKRLIVHAECSSSEDVAWNFKTQGSSRLEESHEMIPLLDETVPLNVHQLWDLLFDMAFQQKFHTKVGDRDQQIGTWQRQGSELVRKKSYVHPVKKNAVGPSEAFTQEESQCLTRNDAGFATESQAYTREVPYGKSFYVQLSWKATKVSGQSTRLVIIGGVVFEKKLLLGSFIKKAAQEGLRQGYVLYKDHLWQHINGINTSSKKGFTPGKSKLRRLDSASIAKSAVEDLIKNGVFVSWASMIKGLLLIYLVYILFRLSNSQNGRLLAPTF